MYYQFTFNCFFQLSFLVNNNSLLGMVNLSIVIPKFLPLIIGFLKIWLPKYFFCRPRINVEHHRMGSLCQSLLVIQVKKLRFLLLIWYSVQKCEK